MSLSDSDIAPHHLADVIDALLEASIFGSFSRIGIAVRRRMQPWDDPPRLEGHTVVVTGASSGIGRAIALGLAGLGANVWLVGRDQGRLEATRRLAVALAGSGRIDAAAVDLVDPVAVASFATRVARTEARLDGLVHCAGALFPDYRTSADGTELTLATHVLGPFRLSRLLFPLLRLAPAPMIVTVSSGGMYTQRFDLDHLELGVEEYKGATAYARAKRAQVVLAHEWSKRWSIHGVTSEVMHPGWVDTPGLSTGLPSFSRLGVLLRTPPQGADTALWLVAGGLPRADPPRQRDELPVGIWLDRRLRHEYYLPHTYRTPAQRRHDGTALWEWCSARIAGDQSAEDRP